MNSSRSISLVLIGAALGLSHPAVSSEAGEATTTPAPTAERLLGLEIGPSGVTFQVASGGCTTKASFSLLIQESYPPQITLMRDVPDYCEAWVPYGERVTFSFEELGVPPGSEFLINNDLVRRYRNNETHNPSPCRATGCSGQVCADEDLITTCEWRPEYACYQGAECARQADGSCGWTVTDALTSCLDAQQPR